MSSQIWKALYAMLRTIDKEVPRVGRRKRFSDVQIVALYMWAVLHDRPQCWATQRENLSGLFRPRRLPSRSQFNRRIKSLRCQALLEALHQKFIAAAIVSILIMDGRALRIGPHSQDVDAAAGWTGGAFAKGYKLHAISSINNLILALRVKALNVCEKLVAMELIRQMKPTGWVLADGYYDAGYLYDLVNEFGGQLLTPQRKNAGLGHRRQSVCRLAATRLWESGEADSIYRNRDAIERTFSQQSSFGGGLAPLPSWVRGLERVTRWVQVKVIVHNLRVQLRPKEAA